MKALALRVALLAGTAICLLWPWPAWAQSTGRIECARSDEYVYLYGSMTTLQVRATLQCGEVVVITLRYEYYFGVRTAKGEEGFVPQASVVVIRDRPTAGAKAPVPGAARERTHYDKQPPEATPARPVPPFTLLKNTAVRVKLVNGISSATAHVGDPVELEVLDPVLVEGLVVLNKGAKTGAVVAEVEAKRKFGHGGRLALSITSLRLADGEQAPLRSYEEVSGSASTSHVSAGKDAVMAENTEFTVLVDGDVHLNREAFETGKDASPTASAPAAEAPKPQ